MPLFLKLSLIHNPEPNVLWFKVYSSWFPWGKVLQNENFNRPLDFITEPCHESKLTCLTCFFFLFLLFGITSVLVSASFQASLSPAPPIHETQQPHTGCYINPISTHWLQQPRWLHSQPRHISCSPPHVCQTPEPKTQEQIKEAEYSKILFISHSSPTKNT